MALTKFNPAGILVARMEAEGPVAVGLTVEAEVVEARAWLRGDYGVNGAPAALAAEEHLHRAAAEAREVGRPRLAEECLLAREVLTAFLRGDAPTEAEFVSARWEVYRWLDIIERMMLA